MAGTKKKLDIYFDIAFFQKFYYDKPNHELSKEFQNWLDFYLFFIESSHICLIDAYDNKTISQSEILLLLAYPQPVEQDKMLIDVNYPYHQIKNPHSLFFLEFSTEQLENLERKFGFIFINSQNYLQKWRLLNPRNHQSFITISSRGDVKNWSDFAYLRHFTNSLIVVDRYLFGGNYAHNLTQMLSNLFHGLENTICFDVTLIIGNEVNSSLKNLIDNRKILGEVERLFKQQFPNCQLTIVQLLKRSRNRQNQETREEIPLTHDRRIISNYFYFSSGDSITYESHPNEMLANTDFHIYSIFDSKTFETMQNRLQEFNYQIENKTHVNNIIGTKQNRLLQ